MHALALTLGHNSSAVLIVDGQVVCGYEQERFSSVKSDSHFPRDAIMEIHRRHNLPRDTKVCVGHWFLDHQLPRESNKYWDEKFLYDLMPDCEILSLDREFSHHDSHLESAMVFAGREFTSNCTAMVIDGFGSSGECFSIYHVTGGGYKLLKRWFGFEKSLGLLYQYATAFLGMKMHNHEYKMLAYEVHLHALDYDIVKLNGLIAKEVQERLQHLFKDGLNPTTDGFLSLTALPAIQQIIDEDLSDFLMEMGAGDASIHNKRCLVSYYVQNVVEGVVTGVADLYTAGGDLLLAGGLFYNVKLNSILAKRTTGRTCILPLAGDQGCGLGVYQRYFGDLEWPQHLAWGQRDLTFSVDGVENMVSFECMDDAMATIINELHNTGFVNIVRGAMEFGPRALCNTTTLAIPDPEIGRMINEVNDRTNEMPFALVVTEDQANAMFYDCGKVHRSLEYMICTRDFKSGHWEGVEGGAHYYPDLMIHTCRPQITTDAHLVALLSEFGPLINTSFNFHGVPIVLGEQQIKYTHSMQQRSSPPGVSFKTIIIRN